MPNDNPFDGFASSYADFADWEEIRLIRNRDRIRQKLNSAKLARQISIQTGGNVRVHIPNADPPIIGSHSKPSAFRGRVDGVWNAMKNLNHFRLSTRPSTPNAEDTVKGGRKIARPQMSKTGRTGQVYGSGNARPARGHLPLSLNPPKNTTPGAAGRDRLGVMGNRSNAGKGGGLFGSFGRGGDVASSYKVRAGANIARNLKGRISLGAAGYIAVLVAGVAEQERNDMNQSIIDAGVPGGYLALRDHEKMQTLGSGQYHDKRLDKTGSVLRSSFSIVPNIVLGGAQLAAEIGGIFNALFYGKESGAAAIQSVMDPVMIADDRIDTWKKGGWAALADWEHPQTKAYRKARDAQNQFLMAANDHYGEMLRRTANEIAMDVVGVSGEDVANGIADPEKKGGVYERWRASADAEFRRRHPDHDDGLKRGMGPTE